MAFTWGHHEAFQHLTAFFFCEIINLSLTISPLGYVPMLSNQLLSMGRKQHDMGYSRHPADNSPDTSDNTIIQENRISSAHYLLFFSVLRMLVMALYVKPIIGPVPLYLMKKSRWLISSTLRFSSIFGRKKRDTAARIRPERRKII